MTVTYTGEVATCRGFGTFLKLLSRWRGSIYKLVWLDLIVFLLVYYVLNLVYRLLLNEESKRLFEGVVNYCSHHGNVIPLSFVLGFYVTVVMNRWWGQYTTIPWPDSIAVFVSATIHGQVALILGVNGACRSVELYNITAKDIECNDDTAIITLHDTKTKIDRMFDVRGEFLIIVNQKLRPVDIKSDRFFLKFQKGMCTKKIIGRHKIAKMPKEIATYLNLTNSECYTGHCFRRSSATLLVDSGANLTTLKRHGGWKSNKVAEGYIEDSVEN